MRKQFLMTLALSVLAISAVAAEVSLNKVTYPDSKSIGVKFAPTAVGPDATVTATTKYTRGQAAIEVKWSNLEPAVLFGGDITTYVVWAVTPDGGAEALGEIGMRDTSGSGRFSTARKDFAMMVTAEPLPTVRRPGELVVFTSGASESKAARTESFTYSGLIAREGIAVGNASIKGMAFKGSEPPILIAARKGVELVERYGAASFAPEAFERAKMELASATSSINGGSKSAGYDYARRSIEGSSQALAGFVKDLEEKAEAARVAREQATKAALGQSEDARRQLEIEQRKLEADKAALEADRARIKAERDALAARLAGALSAVSSTEQTARGYVVSFGDINFDTGKAALKDSAKLNLAKLSGILLMMPALNLRVEGHTDSTGSEELNMKLSGERAGAVKTLLVSMGIEETRIATQGYGPANPIDTNDTKEGRAKNRRVEIILSEGEIAPR